VARPGEECAPLREHPVCGAGEVEDGDAGYGGLCGEEEGRGCGACDAVVEEGNAEGGAEEGREDGES
jgi:hypothetical protein